MVGADDGELMGPHFFDFEVAVVLPEPLAIVAVEFCAVLLSKSAWKPPTGKTGVVELGGFGGAVD